ncbi:MAG: hypothetical protein KatS3mg043_1549 [Rhodothermaceae bacterium]|nr:MAG: hypothetical protein KatS3mg043_1549 [Rhodothermaceae bacterium]
MRLPKPPANPGPPRRSETPHPPDPSPDRTLYSIVDSPSSFPGQTCKNPGGPAGTPGSALAGGRCTSAPVPGHEDPSVAIGCPVRGHPDGPGTGRKRPVSVLPHVPAPMPRPVPRNPDMTRGRTMTVLFPARLRRLFPDDDHMIRSRMRMYHHDPIHTMRMMGHRLGRRARPHEQRRHNRQPYGHHRLALHNLSPIGETSHIAGERMVARLARCQPRASLPGETGTKKDPAPFRGPGPVDRAGRRLRRTSGPSLRAVCRRWPRRIHRRRPGSRPALSSSRRPGRGSAAGPCRPE